MATDSRIDSRCNACNASLSVKPALAGKRVKCPRCGAEVEIPKPAKKATAPAATDRQKEYATSLGIQFSDDISRREISKLIDEVKKAEEEERFKRLTELEYREFLVSEGDTVSPRLSHATEKQMLASLSERGFASVLILMPWKDVIDFKNLEGVQANMIGCEGMTAADVETVVKGLASALLYRDGVIT